MLFSVLCFVHPVASAPTTGANPNANRRVAAEIFLRQNQTAGDYRCA